METDFGWWPLPNGQQGRVSYDHEKRSLYLFKPVGRKGRTYEQLAEFESLGSCRAVLEGPDPWWNHSEEPEGLAWLLGRLDAYDRTSA